MQPNPVLRKLGFSDSDRVAILHVDDVGMCLSGLDAFAELWEVGIISSGAVMVPCPWFPRAAEYARTHPHVDLGVHTTLTSEWRNYRWGPVSTRDPQSGLMDAEGYFHASVAAVAEHADPACVALEIDAQVQKALAAGMQPTHLDTHMGSVANFKFLPAYIKAAITYRLPPMIFRMDAAGFMATRGLDAQTAQMAETFMSMLESAGLPLMDTLATLELDAPDNRLEQAKAAFSGLKPGVTHFYLHPALDREEIHQITYLKPHAGINDERAQMPDWPSRVGDYELLKSEELRRHLKSEGIQVIGYRALQALMPDPSLAQALPF